ncbi:MAG TPA: hypothetical protein VNQ77_13140 [Frankiaceae bacterium]|nr:hypothetical protein [Frankiaceae bacterium]
MSPVAAPARRAPAPSRRTPAKPARPNLRVVTPVPSRAPRAPFVLFSMLVVGLGLVALLFLNTVVAQDAFTLHDLDRGTAELAEREQRLRQEIASLEAPNDLALRARDLGLVPAGDPVFLTPDGKVLGKPVPAVSPPPPPPPPAPKATASAKPKPQPEPKPSAKAKKP